MININDLPSRVLQKIFIMAFESRVLSSMNQRTPTPAKHLLRVSASIGAAVCYRWKEIIHSTDRLWVMRLVLGMPDENSTDGCDPLPLPVYRKWLASSTRSMIDIHFGDFWSARDITQYFDESMELILPHARRWRILDAFRLSPKHTALLLTHIVNNNNLYALRCLALGRGTIAPDDSPDSGLQLLFERAADYEQLQFKEVPSIWAEVPRYNHLQELEVDISQFSDMSSWDNIFGILSRAPRITDLKLTISQPPEEYIGIGRPLVGDHDLGSWIRCPSLQRLELKMEFRYAVFFIDKVELASLTNLHIISFYNALDDSEIQWPYVSHSLPRLDHFTCRHVEISEITTFFAFFHCPALRRLYIYPAVVSSENNLVLPRGNSSTTLVDWKSKLLTSVSVFNLKKSNHLESEKPIIYGSQLPSLEYLHIDAVFPEMTAELLSEVEMPNLMDLDVSSYHPLQCAQFDHALRHQMPKAPLPMLTNLKIDSLDQCCLLRHWAGHGKRWRHLQINDKHGNSRIHWTKFCSHHRDILSEVQALTLQVRAYWLSVPEPFAHFTNLLSLTLEFDSASDGLFQSLLHGRDSRDRVPLPHLKALYLKNCDLDSLHYCMHFIILRREAGRPLKILSVEPFPGDRDDLYWFQHNVAQFDYEWPLGTNIGPSFTTPLYHLYTNSSPNLAVSAAA